MLSSSLSHLRDSNSTSLKSSCCIFLYCFKIHQLSKRTLYNARTILVGQQQRQIEGRSMKNINFCMCYKLLRVFGYGLPQYCNILFMCFLIIKSLKVVKTQFFCFRFKKCFKIVAMLNSVLKVG